MRWLPAIKIVVMVAADRPLPGTRRRTSLCRTWRQRTRDGWPRPWRIWIGWLRPWRSCCRPIGGGGYYGGGGPVYDNGPIYDSCSGYGYGYSGCPGYGVPIIGAVINGVFGGYGGY